MDENFIHTSSGSLISLVVPKLHACCQLRGAGYRSGYESCWGQLSGSAGGESDHA